MIELTKENYDILNNLINNISIKYNGYHRVEKDDLYQELWLKCLTLLKNFDELNIPFFYTCLKNHALQIINKDRRSHKEMAIIENNQMIETENTLHPSRPVSGQDEIDIECILNLFKKDTKEYNFVKGMIHRLGLHYFSDCDSMDMSVRPNLSVAKWMGYAHDTSTGYRLVKGRVQDKLRKCGYRK